MTFLCMYRRCLKGFSVDHTGHCLLIIYITILLRKRLRRPMLTRSRIFTLNPRSYYGNTEIILKESIYFIR